MIDDSRPCLPQVVEGSKEDNFDFIGWHEQLKFMFDIVFGF